MDELPPPKVIPDMGIPLGYSLEHEHRKAPMGFCYSPQKSSDQHKELESILHTGNGHLMTIAPTGSGKGVSCIIPTLLHYPGSVIVIDPKGENFAVTAEYRRSIGQEVLLFDPFGATDHQTNQFNPLQLIKNAEDDRQYDLANELASLLIPRTDSQNPFFDDMAKSLLTGLILYVTDESYPGALSTLAEIRHLLFQPQNEAIAMANLMAKSTKPVLIETAQIYLMTEPKVLASVLSTAQSHLTKFRGAQLDRQMAGNDLDAEKVISGAPLSIYLVIPPDKLLTYQELLRVWVGNIFNLILQRRSQQDNNTLFILDEAAQLGELEALRQAITLLRGYGLQTWSFWQDLSQLKRLYSDWKTLMNNCRVHQVFGITNLMMAQESAQIYNIWTAEELLELDSDELILQIAGDLPVISQKINYLTDPAFQKKAKTNPYYSKEPNFKPRYKQRNHNRPDNRNINHEGLPDEGLRIPSFIDFIQKDKNNT